MDATGRIDAAAVAVLAERVEQSLRNYDELRGMLIAMNAERISDGKTTAVHSFVLKCTGVILVSSLGLIGWGWREGSALKAADMSLDRRTLLIEYKLGIPTATAEGSKQ